MTASASLSCEGGPMIQARIVVWLVSLLLSTSLQQILQLADPDFNAKVENPAYVDRHPSVLFDEAHNNFHTATGRYKPFADLITSDGYRVRPGIAPFTDKTLAG